MKTALPVFASKPIIDHEVNKTRPRSTHRFILSDDALRRHQTGFSLLEISIAMLLAAMLSIGYLYNQNRDQSISTAKAQAGYYLKVSEAVGAYMQTFYNDLKDISTECSVVRLTEGDRPMALSSSVDCKFTTGSAAGSLSPANAMQPTVADLQKLNLLDKRFQDAFVWPTSSTVNSPTELAKPAYATSIQKWCLGKLMAIDESCSEAIQLKSLTFNTQPFDVPSTGSFFSLARHEKMTAAIAAMGGDGLMSLESVMDTEAKGKLYGVGNIISADNPIVYNRPSDYSSNGKGIAGTMAVQNEVTCSEI